MRRPKLPSRRTSTKTAPPRRIEDLDRQAADTLLKCDIGSGTKSNASLTRWLEQIAVVQRHVAPLAIAGSIVDADDWVWPVAEFLGEMDLLHRIQELDARLDVDTHVPHPIPDDPDYQESLENAVVSLGLGFGRAGLVLGLAIGTLLGPHALKVGAR